MKHLLIILSFLLLSSPVIGNNHKGVTLYEWKTSSGDVWKEFGDNKIHRKYMGEVENGVPNGLGIMYTITGILYVGEWRKGKCQYLLRYIHDRYLNPLLVCENGKKIKRNKGGERIDKDGNVIDKEGNIEGKYVDGKWGVYVNGEWYRKDGDGNIIDKVIDKDGTPHYNVIDKDGNIKGTLEDGTWKDGKRIEE